MEKEWSSVGVFHPQCATSGNEEDKNYPSDEDKLINKIKEYWNDLNFDERCQHLTVDIHELQTYLLVGNNKCPKASYILGEAIEYFEENGHWYVLSCCLCEEDHENWRSLEEHIRRKHFNQIDEDVEEISMPEFLNCDDNLVIDFCGNIIIDKEDDIRAMNDSFLIKWFKSNPDLTRALESWESQRETCRLMRTTFLKQIEILRKGKGLIHDGKTTQEKSTINLAEEAFFYSTYDFREIIMPILISFIKYRLEHIVNNKDEAPDDSFKEPKPTYEADIQSDTSKHEIGTVSFKFI